MMRSSIVLLLGSLIFGCSAIVQFKDPPAEMCGDGERQAWEACDGSDLGGETCQTQGFSGGVLICNNECQLMHDQCGEFICGNGIRDSGEECDGYDLGGDSCQSRGYSGGDLACLGNCHFDESNCTDANCGDGFCDLAGGENPASCSNDCTAYCGNGACEVGQGETTAECYDDCAWQVVSVGSYFSCASRIDGSVWCWGSNDYGKLGNASEADFNWPVKVKNLENVAMISTGREHACATNNSAHAFCWGQGTLGQLGYGNFDDRNQAEEIYSIDNIDWLSAGGDTSCAVQSDGSAWCWGSHDAGQLGIGTASSGEMCGSDPCTDEPLPVVVLGAAEDISVGLTEYGSTHVCAVQNGSAWCWGRNDLYQAGHDTLSGDATPVQVLGLGSLNSIASGHGFTCASQADKVWCWGTNYDGQLGSGSASTDATWIPQQVVGISTGVTWLSAGRDHACAVSHDGVAWCWGRNDCGQLGDGTQDNRRTATVVNLPQSVSTISAGATHSCAVLSDGVANSSILCWGNNERGQLGDGTHTSTTTAVEVIDPLPPPGP